MGKKFLKALSYLSIKLASAVSLICVLLIIAGLIYIIIRKNEPYVFDYKDVYEQMRMEQIIM